MAEETAEKSVVDELFGDGPDEVEEITSQALEEPTEELKEEPKETPVVPEMSEDRYNELVEKAESDGLTDEEISELEAAGHEVEKPSRIDELVARLEAGESIDEDLTDEERQALKEKGFEEEEVPEPIDLDETEVSVIQSLYPDVNLGDPKAVREAQKGAMGHLADIVSNFQEAAKASPEASQFLTKLLTEGSSFDFMTEIAILLGDETVAPQPGEDGYEKYVEAKIQKKTEREQAKKREAERQTNLERSRMEVKKFYEDNNIPKERAIKTSQVFNDFIKKFNEGNVHEYMPILYKGLYADVDQKDAVEKAKIQVKNSGWQIRKKNVGMPQVKSGELTVKSKNASSSYVNDMMPD